MKKNSNRKDTVKRILKYVKKYRINVLFSFLCAMVSSAAQLVIPIFCGDAIDYMIGKGRVDFQKIGECVLCIAGVMVVAAIAQQILAVCNNRVTYGVSRDLRNEAVKKLQRLPLSYLDSHPAGDSVSRITADVDSFADGLLMGFTQLFTSAVTIVGTLAIMIALNGAVTVIVAVLTPLSLFTAAFIAKRTHKYFQKQTVVRGEQTALINELVGSQSVVQAYCREQTSLEEFDEINNRMRKASFNATFFSSLTNPTTRLVNNLVYAGVSLVSAFFAISGGITIGQLSIFLNYAGQYAKPFNEISSVVTELQNALACAERIFELLDEKEEIPDSDDAVAFECRGAVDINNISFSYTPDRPLIEDFSLNVEPGQHIAIVGPTGCGKTTLINLLMRFYDVKSGEIKIDGVNIGDMTKNSLRANYGMVLQDTWLKSGTVRDNIAYGKPDATDEEIKAAAKAAHAHSFIRRLPDGYDTVITENGENISAGQRQLLCIARVMLSLPPMLILDEATSSIDTRTELKIQSAFTRMMKGRTCFIVAHRLSTIREADVVLVMKNGKIVEKGNHKELLKKGGFYSELYNSQFANN